jgi:hypothetical protein
MLPVAPSDLRGGYFRRMADNERATRWWATPGALWTGAFVVAVVAGGYQRVTGPTFPARGTARVAGATYKYDLPRSGTSTTDETIAVPAAPGVTGGILRYRRLRSNDDWSTRTLVRDRERWTAALPREPAAGKVEYQVLLGTPQGMTAIPKQGSVVLRFKNPVPAWLLIPHILLMFSALLLGIRTGLGAVFAPHGVQRLVRATVAAMTLGGLVLGPLVQRAAFGQLWTGFPIGRDLTDNKTIIMWLAWAAAALALTVARPGLRAMRAITLAAAVVMLAVFLVPHSVQGSELDFTKLEQRSGPATTGAGGG